MKKYIFILSAFALMFWSCTPEPIAPRDEKSATKLTKTHTIAQFLSEFMTEEGDYAPVRSRANNGGSEYLFSISDIPADGPDIVIEGRVISDDAAGNLYKVMVIQDTEFPEQALRIGIDAGSIGGIYQLGQVIRIRCNGLCVGKYADQPQLCVASFNNNYKASHADEKVGWAPGRIPFPRFQKAVEMVGMPDKSKIVLKTMTIPEIVAHTGRANGQQDYQAVLVKIENVHFTNEYWDTYGAAQTCANDNPANNTNAGCFAPTTNNVGYPQGRLVADVNGNKIAISTSEYADFAHVVLPSSEFTGSVVGILGFYRDNIKYAAANDDWSITVRSLDDIQIFDAQGKPWVPQEWKAAE